VHFGPFTTPTMHVLMIPTETIGRGAYVVFVILALEDVNGGAF